MMGSIAVIDYSPYSAIVKVLQNNGNSGYVLTEQQSDDPMVSVVKTTDGDYICESIFAGGYNYIKVTPVLA